MSTVLASSRLRETPDGDGYVRTRAGIERRYDRTTTVIRYGLPFWEGVDEDVKLAAAERGTQVHRACYELAKSPDPEELAETFHEELRGYAQAWLAFQRATEFRPWLVEEPLASDSLLVAGRPDAIGPMKKNLTVVDYTVGTATLAKQLQTAVYERLWRENHAPSRDASIKRIEVHLRPNGRFTFRPHEDPGDFRGFLGLLGWYRYCRSRGVQR